MWRTLHFTSNASFFFIINKMLEKNGMPLNLLGIKSRKQPCVLQILASHDFENMRHCKALLMSLKEKGMVDKKVCKQGALIMAIFVNIMIIIM